MAGFDDFHARNDEGFSGTTSSTAPAAAAGFHGSAVRAPSFHDSFGAVSIRDSAPPAVPAAGAGFATMDGDTFEPSPIFAAGHSGSGFDDGFGTAATSHHHGFVEYNDEPEFPPAAPPASDQDMDVFMPPPPPVPPSIPAAPAASHQQLSPQPQSQPAPPEEVIPGLPSLAPQLDLDDFEQSFAYRLREVSEPF